MQWLDMETGNCSVERTLAVIGEKWTIIILREAFNGVRRFEQIREHTGMSDSVLADRLRKLLAAGVLRAVPYQEPGSRLRNEYRLTAKGLDLFPVMIALLQWGDRHLADPAGPALEITHSDCDQPVSAVVRCAAGHELASAAESQTRPGPGSRARATAAGEC